MESQKKRGHEKYMKRYGWEFPKINDPQIQEAQRLVSRIITHTHRHTHPSRYVGVKLLIKTDKEKILMAVRKKKYYREVKKSYSKHACKKKMNNIFQVLTKKLSSQNFISSKNVF